MAWLPARIYARWTPATISGSVTFRVSGMVPGFMPAFCSMVPMAPSSSFGSLNSTGFVLNS